MFHYPGGMAPTPVGWRPVVLHMCDPGSAVMTSPKEYRAFALEGAKQAAPHASGA
jgi:hypothetical protein